MRFLAPALSYLQGLYRPQGGLVTTDRINLEGDVQLVHDVSRGAELASGLGKNVALGYWLLGTGDVHAGADAVDQSYNPRTTIIAAGFPEPFDVWLLPGIFGFSATNASISICTATLLYPPLPGQTAQTQRVVFQTVGRSSAPTTGGDVAVDTGSIVPRMLPQPTLLPIGTFISTKTVSLLASTITIICPVWVGAVGARPPGVS